MAAELGIEFAPDVDALLASGIDGFVIATATPAHAPLLRQGVAAGLPTFCEKPVASTLEETLGLADLVASTDVPVHVGFQRRFDAGYRGARPPWQSGELGFIHTIRAGTHDQAPPHASYIPTSGGIFRDCNVHDFDILRFVTGREVASVYATGANKGATFFAEAGDVDTAGALLTLDDGTLIDCLRRPATTAPATTSAWRSTARRARSPSGWTTRSRCAPPRRASTSPGPPEVVVHGALPARVPGRAHRLRSRSPAASGPPPAPSTTPSRPSASPRPCELSRAERRPVDLYRDQGRLTDVVTAVRPRSPGRPSPGGSARCRAGASSSTRTRCSPQMSRPGASRDRVRPGWLPARCPGGQGPTLGRHGLQAVGQFVPVVLHDPTHDPLPEVRRPWTPSSPPAPPPWSSPPPPVRRATTSGPSSTTPAGAPCSPTSTGCVRRPPPRA